VIATAGSFLFGVYEELHSEIACHVIACIVEGLGDEIQLRQAK
jgi:hypothetical protein